MSTQSSIGLGLRGGVTVTCTEGVQRAKGFLSMLTAMLVLVAIILLSAILYNQFGKEDVAKKKKVTQYMTVASFAIAAIGAILAIISRTAVANYLRNCR